MLKRSAARADTVATSPAAHHVTVHDELFVALDGRPIDAGRRSWVLRVEGIHDAAPGAWVQVACSLTPDRTLVLHVPPHVSSSQVVAVLHAWSALAPDVRPQIVRVTASPGVDAGPLLHAV